MRAEPTSQTRSQRAAAIVRRAVELSRVAARGVRTLAVAAAVSVGVAWTAWVSTRPPTGANDWAARVVVLGLGLLPPAVLALFVLGLRELAELPKRVRELPPELRTQVADVRARAARRRGRVGLVAAVVRLARLVFEARDALSPYAVVSAVLRPALLLAAMLAAIVALVEIPAALISVLWLLLA